MGTIEACKGRLYASERTTATDSSKSIVDTYNLQVDYLGSGVYG